MNSEDEIFLIKYMKDLQMQRTRHERDNCEQKKNIEKIILREQNE